MSKFWGFFLAAIRRRDIFSASMKPTKREEWDLSKPLAIAATGVLGIGLSVIGVAKNLDFAGLFLNLGAGFVGSCTTYILFDLFIGRREENYRQISALMSALHGADLDLKNYLLGRFPRNVSIRGVALYGANMTRTEWSGLTLIETDFAFCQFDTSILEDCSFERCTFTSVSFTGSSAANCTCTDCEFIECVWTDSLWPLATFAPAPPADFAR